MNSKELVTKSYLEQKLLPLIGQNEKAVQSLSRAVYQHRYYIQSHRGRVKTNIKYKVELRKISKMVQKIIRAANLGGLKPNRSFVNKGSFVRLPHNDFARLKKLLATNHLYCARIPHGLAIPYLDRNQLRMLKRLLKRGD